LAPQQRKELLDILDKFPECFSDKPGCCDWIQHEIRVTESFKPKRLRAYRVPGSLKTGNRKTNRRNVAIGHYKAFQKRDGQTNCFRTER